MVSSGVVTGFVRSTRGQQQLFSIGPERNTAGTNEQTSPIIPILQQMKGLKAMLCQHKWTMPQHDWLQSTIEAVESGEGSESIF
jgi:hypothetical protein